MSQQYPQQQPPFQQPPVQSPAKAKRPWLIVGLVGGGALLFGGGFAVGAVSTADDTSKATSNPIAVTTTSAPAPVVAEETTPEAPPEPTFGTPKKTDFKLTAKVLGKQCFGSAGCNVTYRVLVTYNGADLDPAASYDVVYEVRGGDDGAVTNTLKVTGDQSSVDEEESVSTKNKAAKLTVVVTDVLGG